MFFYSADRGQRRGASRWGGAVSWKARTRRASVGAAGKTSPVDGSTEEEPAGAMLAPAHSSAANAELGRGIDLKSRIATASLAFRGYDVQNLGRSPELLAHPVYGPTVRRFLDTASAVASDTLHRRFDLAGRVERQEPTTVSAFAEDIGVIVSMEMAQLALLEEFHGVQARGARQSFGYSLGEMASVISGGMFTMEELLPVPLGCADDCADLAADTTLGVIFSRGPAIALKDVQDLCLQVSNEGRGMVGVSSYLSPNTILVIGQGATLDRLEQAIPGRLPAKTMLRRKSHKLPPLHTPLVWQRNIPNRAAVALYKIPGGRPAPKPKIVSCVTGTASYDPLNARDTLVRWVDQPQLLWDVIVETLVAGVDLLVHVGPAPNLIPATFERLGNNVGKQFGNRYMKMLGHGVGSQMGRYAWLSRLLPTKAALLRAPHVEHLILEDWLLDRAPT